MQQQESAPDAASVGKDPLTWVRSIARALASHIHARTHGALITLSFQSFVKLFAHQITRELGEFEGVPGSHAWKWVRDGIWRARLVTKAQVVGVLVSVHERNERGTFCV